MSSGAANSRHPTHQRSLRLSALYARSAAPCDATRIVAGANLALRRADGSRAAPSTNWDDAVADPNVRGGSGTVDQNVRPRASQVRIREPSFDCGQAELHTRGVTLGLLLHAGVYSVQALRRDGR